MVSWKSLSPIFADVIISPWNLLIGGLIAQNLSFGNAVVATIVGNFILSLLILVYGGLGWRARVDTSKLIEPVFGYKGAIVFLGSILALGQIGWFGVIVTIGGESLSSLMGVSRIVGISIYACLMVFMASMKLHQMALVKLFIVVSSISLIGYLLFGTLIDNSVYSIIQLHVVSQEKSLFWGVGVAVASLISFTSVTPDFMSQARSQSDVLITTIIGVFLPLSFMSILGILLFSNQSELSIDLILSASAFPIFMGHLFNVITNTDAAIAAYTPGLRLTRIFGITHIEGIVISSLIGLLLATIGIVDKLEIWLGFLAAIYPTIIGLTLATYFVQQRFCSTNSAQDFDYTMISIVAVGGLGYFLFDLHLLILTSILFSFVLGILIQCLRCIRKTNNRRVISE
ncbi:MAG: hypothetical protein H6673_15625 [Anaerolineales bacterium]|nr:hypothetical protein [Anaerolineales bacterium]